MKKSREFNYPRAQSGINTYESAKNKIRVNGYVSIIWDKIPKSHTKNIKKLVENMTSELIEKTTINHITTPAHINYYI